MSISQRDSKVINAIKFILIVFVVYIHILPNFPEPIHNDLSGLNTYHFVSEAISHNLCKIAVPAFFVLSGFFFFNKLSDSQNKLSFFCNQWKKRVVSLLVPYLFWNLLYVAVIVLKNRAFLHFGLPADDFYDQIKTMGPYWIFWEMPIDFPLWYVRDLMCMVVLAPLFYFFVKHTRLWGITALGLWYFSPFEIGIPGLSATAFFFFGIGAYIGYGNKDLFFIPQHYGRLAFLIGLPLLFAATILNNTIYHEYLIRLFCPLGIIALFYSVWKMPDRMIERLSRLSVTVFFIFASHQIYIINWTKGLFLKLLGTSVLSQFITYLFAPILVLFVCIMTYYVIKKIAPRCLAFSIGNRKT